MVGIHPRQPRGLVMLFAFSARDGGATFAEDVHPLRSIVNLDVIPNIGTW